MNNTLRFRVNSPKVVHETIDGEVVIVNLEKGDYYSLLGAGADIWEGLARGESAGEVVEAICQHYQGDRETITSAIERFIEELQQEEMIAPDASLEAPETAANGGTKAGIEIGEKLVFEAPSLQKYTDMEELLALDPIHDVDEDMGWPRAKVEA
ncbi:PqqD family protein [Oscillatoria sp. FACHB-1406]|uniref:PqqD family protein n=1 Tax=Oscillatoria sp. FACHB-1406 TaxID=2692846 RepID=UPI0016823067|nr:PqqD family protein [Oscillatoria sp. FACHB-1406]MBD2578884.1 PqqD family protein [Oscillatoria sp. FACHB-1406]